MDSRFTLTPGEVETIDCRMKELMAEYQANDYPEVMVAYNLVSHLYLVFRDFQHYLKGQAFTQRTANA